MTNRIPAVFNHEPEIKQKEIFVCSRRRKIPLGHYSNELSFDENYRIYQNFLKGLGADGEPLELLLDPPPGES